VFRKVLWTQNTAALGRVITLTGVELLQKARHPTRIQRFRQRINSGTCQGDARLRADAATMTNSPGMR
jgi:hypothetical protein